VSSPANRHDCCRSHIILMKACDRQPSVLPRASYDTYRSNDSLTEHVSWLLQASAASVTCAGVEADMAADTQPDTDMPANMVPAVSVPGASLTAGARSSMSAGEAATSRSAMGKPPRKSRFSTTDTQQQGSGGQTSSATPAARTLTLHNAPSEVLPMEAD